MIWEPSARFGALSALGKAISEWSNRSNSSCSCIRTYKLVVCGHRAYSTCIAVTTQHHAVYIVGRSDINPAYQPGRADSVSVGATPSTQKFEKMMQRLWSVAAVLLARWVAHLNGVSSSTIDTGQTRGRQRDGTAAPREGLQVTWPWIILNLIITVRY